MDPKAAVMIASMLCGTVITTVIVFGLVKWFTRPRSTAPAPAPDYSSEQNRRLHSLEQAVEAIAVEVERIGEGQRHAMKVMGERAAADQAMLRPPMAYRPTNTPH